MTNEHFERKIGRPKKCPIDCLQTQVFMHSLCEELGVPHTGGQLERIFDRIKYGPNDKDVIQRKGKFRRLIRGLNAVSHRTVETISNHPKTIVSRSLLDCSLWQALKPEGSNPNWLHFFKTLRPSLQDIALTSDSNNETMIKRVNRYSGGEVKVMGLLD